MKASSLILNIVNHAPNLDPDTYSPNSKHWHRPYANGLPCQICFAGVWLAQQFKPTMEIDINDLNSQQANTCVFLDRIRRRQFVGIRHYAHGAGIDEPRQVEEQLERLHTDVPEFRCEASGLRRFDGWDTFNDFLAQMDRLAKELEARNL